MFSDPRRSLEQVNPKNIHAVRGAKTLELLRENRDFKRDVPLGDPGIFANELLEPRDIGEKRYTHCVIPHHAFTNHPYFAELGNSEERVLLDPRTDRLEFLKTMCRAEIVISQSLHGLVFAVALGIPCVWISHTTDDVWTFKFWDWFSNIVEPPKAPIPLGVPLKALSVIARRFQLHSTKDALRGSFPELVQSNVNRRVGFRDSRPCEPFVVSICRDERKQTSYDYFAQIVLSSSTEQELQSKLNAISKGFHDLPNMILVFDEDLFLELTVQELGKLRRVLEEKPELHYICVQRTADSGLQSTDHRGPFDLCELQSGSQWNGVYFVQHGVNFSFSAPGIAATRLASQR